MNTRYTDPYVICPFYSYEESSTVRKIHCEGYKKGVYLHLYFKTKELKNAHKKSFCKSSESYQNCPLCKANLEYRGDKDND